MQIFVRTLAPPSTLTLDVAPSDTVVLLFNFRRMALAEERWGRDSSKKSLLLSETKECLDWIASHSGDGDGDGGGSPRLKIISFVVPCDGSESAPVREKVRALAEMVSGLSMCLVDLRYAQRSTGLSDAGNTTRFPYSLPPSLCCLGFSELGFTGAVR